MRLNQIRDFLAAVESGSIRAAARKLAVAQPTITKSVRSLEAELRVQLLRRSATGIELTAAGRVFFARARVAQSELRKAEAEMAALGGSSVGAVAFGVGALGAVLIVPDAVARFRGQYPRARVRVIEGLSQVLFPMVRDETLDFAVGFRPEGKLDAALRFRALFRSPLVVAARKGHPLVGARSLAELANADWLATSTIGAPGGPLERVFASVGLPGRDPLVRCESYNALVGLLARTDMVAMLQRWWLTQPFARGTIEEIRIVEPLPSPVVGLMTRADSPPTRVAGAMARAVSVVARGLARTA